ncbi:MAG: DUF2231 domain-containing protein [Burkholderiales bacterium]
MESKAKFLGHPVHPMLVVFPLGLLGTAVIFDVIHPITRNSAFSIAAYWMIAAGLIGGLIAAPMRCRVTVVLVSYHPRNRQRACAGLVLLELDTAQSRY